MDNKQGKIGYITFISVISAISVLIYHTNGWSFENFSAAAPSWKIANVIESVFYFPVPLFFMISGITLMDFYERDTLKSYLIKRFKKAVVPYLAWSLIGLAGKMCFRIIPPETVNFQFIVDGLAEATIVSIYWFFIPLFGLYLAMPLFAAVEKARRKTVFTFLVIAGFCLETLVPFLNNVFSLNIALPFHLPVIAGALIWPPLGWLLDHCCQEKKHRITVYALAVLGLLLHIFGTSALSVEKGRIMTNFKGYQNVPCVLYSAGVFVMLKQIGIKVMSGKAARFFQRLGNYTFPIYLMQFITLGIGSRLPFIESASLLYTLAAPAAMIPVIIAGAWIIRRIPVIRRILP